MSVFIVPGTERTAVSLTSVLQEVEDDINGVPRDSFKPQSIIPEVVLRGLIKANYVAGEVSGTEEELEFVAGDAASAWNTILKISVDGTGTGYGSDHRHMDPITVYGEEQFGGVVVEWDISLDRATSWIAPSFTTVHALSRLVVEVEVEVCNDADTGTSTNWHRVAGPFYQRTNAVFSTSGIPFPITDSEFNLDAGANNPVTGITFSGAVLLDADTMATAVGDPVNIDIYGVRVHARVWCSDAQYTNMTSNVLGLVPVAVFDLANSRLIIEHTRAGVLQ